MTSENNSPLERLLDWCAGQVASLRLCHQIPSTGEIDDDEVRQEIEQVEADMRAVERDHRSLVDAYGAAIQELQRLGAKSVPLAYHQPPRHGLEEFERNLRRSMATAMQIPEHMLGPLPAPQVYEVLAASVRSKGSGGGEPEPDAVLGMRAIRWQFQSERSVEPRHGGDFVGTGGPLPGEPGNPNPSFEQMEANHTPPGNDARGDVLETIDYLKGYLNEINRQEDGDRDHELESHLDRALQLLTEPAVPEAVPRIRCGPDKINPHAGKPIDSLADELEAITTGIIGNRWRDNEWREGGPKRLLWVADAIRILAQHSEPSGSE